MFKIWVKDRSMATNEMLPHLLASMEMHGEITEAQYDAAQPKVSSGDFEIQPDSQRGGVNVVFGD